ncbi:MAG: molybdopterin molybdotransferase MoeA [Syntrophales bacterium]|nr:molybdopterin molybdotransferase MoeA [Syntrophales bacterium]
MKTAEDCLSQIIDFVSSLGVERVAITESLNRVIAKDIYSSRHIPPRDNSAMDGYALKWEDIKKASREVPVTLRCVEEIPAGIVPDKSPGRGEVSRIMTGAPIPDGADAVVKIEDVDTEGDRVTFFEPVGEGANVRRRGEDVTEGETVIAKGTLIGPAHMGMLAATGNSLVPVYKRPVVAIISTGDELMDIDGDPSSGRIVNSNSYSLFGQVTEGGGIPLILGIAKDNRGDVFTLLSKAKEEAHVIISSGGVSVGDYDFVQSVFKNLGARVEFDTVAQRPGKPFTFATLGSVPFFGLPGNPVSAMMSFEQYVRPALRKITGHRALYRKTVKAVLEEKLAKRSGFTYFLRGILSCRNGRMTVRTTGDQGSGILKSMVLANGIIVLPRAMTNAERGDEVAVQLIDNSLLAAAEPQYLDF